MVRNLIERGDLPCVRIGAAVRVAQSDLDAYVETLRQDRGES
jgi:excisionase family DNA binding protein